MALFIDGAKEVDDVYANVGNATKRIASVWVNKNGVPTKVHSSGGRGLLVCVGTGPAMDGAIYTSTNARLWEQQEVPTQAAIYAVTYGQGKFVYGCSNGLYYSSAGIKWSKAFVANQSSITFNCIAVAYGHDSFVALARLESSGAYTYVPLFSDDGISWRTTSSTLGTGNDRLWTGMVRRKQGFGCIGYGAFRYSANNGYTWNGKTQITGAGQLNSVAYGGTYRMLVCVGDNGQSYSSITDGTSWTKMTGLDNASYRSVTYGNGRFVCVGDNGKAYYTKDGSIWSPMSGLGNTSCRAVTYGAGRFVCVGDGGKSFYSKDGTTWHSMSGNVRKSITLFSVAFNVDGGYDVV